MNRVEKMVLALVILLVVSVAGAGAHDDLAPLYTNPMSSSSYYVNEVKISENRYVTIWNKVTYSEVQKHFEASFNEVKSLVEIDCRDKMMRQLVISYRNDGVLMKTINAERDAKWMHIEPDTNATMYLDIVCKKYLAR